MPSISLYSSRKSRFLDRMNVMVPWLGIVDMLRPWYPSSRRGRKLFPLMLMLRIHCLQLWFDLSDGAAEDALHDVLPFRQFAGIRDCVPDRTTIMNFRHFLEKHNAGEQILVLINDNLKQAGLMLRSANSQTKCNELFNESDTDKIAVMMPLESVLYEGKTFNSERFYIEKRLDDGVRQADIARELAISPSTVSRELKRNTDPTFNTLYSSRRAETISQERRGRASANNTVIELSIDVLSFIRQQLTLHTSPKVISGRLKKLFDIAVSKNTLYRYIRDDKHIGGKLYLLLPHRRR